MSQELAAVYEELSRLKEAGLERVAVAPETLERIQSLKGAISTNRAAAKAAKPSSNDSKASEPPVELEKAATVVPAKPAEAIYPEPPVVDLPEGDRDQQMAALRNTVEHCETCKAHLSDGGKIVFGTGAIDADIFFCGEAPGADEAKAGEPFVGPAGQLLNKIISAMGLSRESVYIANILKWRPEHDKPYGNRPPTSEEMRLSTLPQSTDRYHSTEGAHCLGNTAVTASRRGPQAQDGPYSGQMACLRRHRPHDHLSPRLPTPQRYPAAKRQVWEDMLEVMRKTGMRSTNSRKCTFCQKRARARQVLAHRVTLGKGQPFFCFVGSNRNDSARLMSPFRMASASESDVTLHRTPQRTGTVFFVIAFFNKE